jgi:hypothetical protein
MSNSVAIATVTSVLAKLLDTGVKLNDDGTADPDLTDLDVTTLPVGKARNNKTSNQLNIFLYLALPNAALRNADFPRKVRSGESGIPPLALNLHYLITAYGKGDDDRISHRIIGRAMRILSDFPLVGVSSLFSSSEIQALLSVSEIDLQPEHIRITPLSLTLDEMSKLWMMFQTDYRISAAFQASVVLIESMQPVQSAYPVLKRGAGDEGAVVSASRMPILTAVQPASSMPAATLGTDLKIEGRYLDAEGATVRFSNMHLPAPVELDPLPDHMADRIGVHLASLAGDTEAYTRWIPGFYTVALICRNPGQPALITNQVPVALAPSIGISPLTAPAGDVLLTITCTPRVRDEQPVVLLFGESQVPVRTRSTPTDPLQPTTFTFLVKKAVAGTWLIRLRVDGVDSLPFIVSGTPPLIDFDPGQKVTIT